MIYYLTQGEYSDFRVIGLWEGPAGVELDLARLFDLWHSRPDKEAEADDTELPGSSREFRESEFCKFLERYGGLRPIEGVELHLGAYGSVATGVEEREARRLQEKCDQQQREWEAKQARNLDPDKKLLGDDNDILF